MEVPVRKINLCAAMLGLSIASVSIAEAADEPKSTPPLTQAPSDPKTNDQPQPLNRNQPLSEQLNKNEGVIPPPPSLDPELTKPAPPDFKSNMPVIPPPGEPGGNQQIQPK
jgi:hypothetical protein